MKNKDEKINEKLHKFLKEKQINKFYKIYEGNESQIEEEKTNQKDLQNKEIEDK